MPSRTPIDKRIYLAIKQSNSVEDEVCVLCGQPAYPFEGPELFLADTWDLVCWNCGATHDSMLVNILAAVYDLDTSEGSEEGYVERKITPAA